MRVIQNSALDDTTLFATLNLLNEMEGVHTFEAQDRDNTTRYFPALDIDVEDADMRWVVRAVGESGSDDVELLLVPREGMI
jgi:hypothetical protein